MDGLCQGVSPIIIYPIASRRALNTLGLYSLPAPAAIDGPATDASGFGPSVARAFPFTQRDELRVSF